jgi:UDP-N-acetylglucosamine 2-epimerase (non-hydrolysing)
LSSDKKILLVVGTRPEIIKVNPVIESLDKLGVKYSFVWTGQHYDYEMSRIFFDELTIPAPDIYLNIKPTANSFSFISRVIEKLYELVFNMRSYIYSLGDTNTTLAAALTAYYSGTAFIHDEAGVRSFDLNMMEEFNRRVADMIATIRLAPTYMAFLNLLSEHINPGMIFIVGSTAVDMIVKYMHLVRKYEDNILARFSLDKCSYILLTVHRRENLTTENMLKVVKIIVSLARLFPSMKILFPIHPHTRKVLSSMGYIEKIRNEKNVVITKPLSYLNFLALLKASSFVITDSGGVQEEAFILGKDTITLRDRTEWPETVLMGKNHLVGLNLDLAVTVTRQLIERSGDNCDKSMVSYLDSNPLGDGRAGYRIAKVLNIVSEQGVDYFVNSLRDKLEITLSKPIILTGVLECKEASERCLGIPLCISQGVLLHPYLYSSNRGSFSISSSCEYCFCRGLLGSNTDFLKDIIKVDWNKLTKLVENL